MTTSATESITLRSGDFNLRGILFQSYRRARSVVLFVHGYASTWNGQKSQTLLALCQKKGWSFAAFALRGHGESDGTLADLTGHGVQDDLDAIALFLSTRGLGRIYLVGSSMGGWAGGWFAARHPGQVIAMAGIAPAFAFPRFRLERLSEAEHQRWKTERRVPAHNISRGTDEFLDYALIDEMSDFHPGLLAANWKIPLLIFHGMLDDVIPYIHNVAFTEQIGSGPEIELLLFRRGDHRLQPYCERMVKMTLDFFARHSRDGN